MSDLSEYKLLDLKSRQLVDNAFESFKQGEFQRTSRMLRNVRQVEQQCLAEFDILPEFNRYHFFIKVFEYLLKQPLEISPELLDVLHENSISDEKPEIAQAYDLLKRLGRKRSLSSDDPQLRKIFSDSLTRCKLLAGDSTTRAPSPEKSKKKRTKK